MASWWRQFAETLGATDGKGPWKRLCAEALGASGKPWARAVAEEIGDPSQPGSWSRRAAKSEHPNDNTPWAAQLQAPEEA